MPERRSSRTPIPGLLGAAVILGVVVSVLSYVQMSSVTRNNLPSLIAGLALGTIVAGIIVRARGWRGWLAVGVRIVAAQLLLGVVLFVLFFALRAATQGV